MARLPFSSLGRALHFYFTWTANLTAAKSVDTAQVSVDGGRSALPDLQADWLSVALCLRGLSQLERILLEWTWLHPRERLERPTAALLRRARTKAGREARRRGVVE